MALDRGASDWGGAGPEGWSRALALERARCLCGLGRDEEALAICGTLRDDAWDDACLLAGLAVLSDQFGRHEEAGVLYSRCTELSDLAGYLRSRAGFHIRQGHLAESEEDIAQAAASEPYHPITFVRYGQMGLAKGLYSEALAAFREAAVRDPYEVLWQHDVALAQLASHDPDALVTFERALGRTELHEQVEGALEDLSLLERSRPELPQLAEIKARLTERRQFLDDLAEHERQQYLSQVDPDTWVD